jgi:hypothetical protein
VKFQIGKRKLQEQIQEPHAQIRRMGHPEKQKQKQKQKQMQKQMQMQMQKQMQKQMQMEMQIPHP